MAAVGICYLLVLACRSRQPVELRNIQLNQLPTRPISDSSAKIGYAVPTTSHRYTTNYFPNEYEDYQCRHEVDDEPTDYCPAYEADTPCDLDFCTSDDCNTDFND